jgi:DNA primase
MDNPIEEIKKRIDIVDFIGSFIDLKKSGRNFKALCPFHQEKTPSFIISPERQIWHCFGACQEGGDAIKFLMKWENITFYEALKELAEKLGIKLKKFDFEDRAWKKKERLFTINSLANEFYHYLLTKHKIGRKALDYLKNRKTNRKIIDTFNLGYSPSSWDSLLKFLKKKGFQRDEAYEAGLLVKSEKGNFYDRFRKRLMFPIKDQRGNILGFSGRILGEKGESKYINTPETPIYHKRESLFGINLAKEAIKKMGRAILVEGELDMISCFREGITNAVAIKGSAITKEQLMLLKHYTNQVVLSLDADIAGEETTKRAIVDAENLDFDVLVVSFDFAKDPDEALKKDPLAFKKIIEKPMSIYDFIIDLSLKKNKGQDAISKKNIGNETIPFIAGIKNPIVQSHYLKKIAEILEVDPQAVKLLMRKEINKQKKRHKITFQKKTSDKDRYHLLQTYVVSLIFQSDKPDKLFKKIFNVLEEDDFSYQSYKKLLQAFVDFQAKTPKKQLEKESWREKFSLFLAKELIPVFNQLVLFDIAIFSDVFLEKELEKTIFEFKKLSLKKRIKEKNSEIEEVKRLTSLLSSVEKKLVIL